MTLAPTDARPPDHLGGFLDLPATPVLLAPAEIETIERGRKTPTFEVTPAHAESVAPRAVPIDFAGRRYEIFDRHADLFGDGSVVVVPLSGHTPGSVGVLVNLPDGRRIFHVGDAVNNRRQISNLRGLIPPGPAPHRLQWRRRRPCRRRATRSSRAWPRRFRFSFPPTSGARGRTPSVRLGPAAGDAGSPPEPAQRETVGPQARPRLHHVAQRQIQRHFFGPGCPVDRAVRLGEMKWEKPGWRSTAGGHEKAEGVPGIRIAQS